MNTVGPASAKTTLRSKPLVLALQLSKHIVDLYPAANEVAILRNKNNEQGAFIELYEKDTDDIRLDIHESDDHQLEVTHVGTGKTFKSPFDYGLAASAAGIVRELLEVTPEG